MKKFLKVFACLFLLFALTIGIYCVFTWPRIPAHIYGYKGFSLHRQGKYEEAINSYTKAIELNPKSVAMFYNWRAEPKIEIGDYVGAEEDIKHAIELEPNFCNHYCALADLKIDLEQYQEALLNINKAIDLCNPKDEVYNVQGIIKRKLKDYEGAVVAFTKAIELNPKNLGPYFNRAYAKNNLKDYEGALADYNYVLENISKDTLISKEETPFYMERVYRARAEVKRNLGDEQGAQNDENKANELLSK